MPLYCNPTVAHFVTCVVLNAAAFYIDGFAVRTVTAAAISSLVFYSYTSRQITIEDNNGNKYFVYLQVKVSMLEVDRWGW